MSHTRLAYVAAWDSRSVTGTVNQSEAVVIDAETWNIMVRDRNRLQRLAGFASDLLCGIMADQDSWGDEFVEEIVMPLALQRGLVERVSYNSNIHGDEIDAEPGDMIWWMDATKWGEVPA